MKISAPRLRLKVDKMVGYIGKYIGKGYEYEVLNAQKSFTASQIKQIYKLSPRRLDEIVSRFGKRACEMLSCTYRRVFTKMVNEETEQTEIVTLFTFPCEWEYRGEYGEPF